MGDHKISVLTVDDEAGLADSIQRVLTSEGYVVLMETDGMAAVNTYKANRPDIMLIDVALGDNSINGIEVLKEIREFDPQAICIMVTRLTDEMTVKRTKDLGALHYVLKPLSGDDIIEIVKQAVPVVQQKRAANA